MTSVVILYRFTFFIGLGAKVTPVHLIDFPFRVTPRTPTAAEFCLITKSFTYGDLLSPDRTFFNLLISDLR